MSNIEFIDGTVRVWGLGSITAMEYSAVKILINHDDVKQAVALLVLRCGYSRKVAELIVYELI